MTVIIDFEMMCRCNLLLQFVYLWFLELNNQSAFYANHVIMVPVRPGRLKTRLSISKMLLYGNSTLRQQLQRSMNRRVADLRMFFS